MSDESRRCPWCGSARGFVWVTSHVQCLACGQIVESCCEGPACSQPEESAAAAPTGAEGG